MTDICIAHGGDLGEPSGGTDRVSAIAGGLTERGYDVRVVAPEPAGDLPEALRGIPVETIDIPAHGVRTQPRRAYQVSREALKLARECDATVQFEHSTLAGVGTLLGASEYVLDMHDLAFRSPLYGDLPLGNLVQRAILSLERRATTCAESIVATSNIMKGMVIDTWCINPDDIVVIPNGYFEDRIAPYRTTETVHGRVVFLGTLHPKLNIDAMRRIARLPEVEEFVVIGDGNRRSDIERVSNQVDSMRVTGRLPDEKAFVEVSKAAVAVNPQHPSGLQVASSPVKLYYYAALGVPPVVTQGPELADKLDREDAAVVVSPDEDFPTAVKDLLRSDCRRAAMASKLADASDTFRWSERVDRFASIHG